MKTWQAKLAHIGIGAAQAALGMQFFAGNQETSALANTGVQIALQLALSALHNWAAAVNSNTDQQGNPLPPKP